MLRRFRSCADVFRVSDDFVKGPLGRSPDRGLRVEEGVNPRSAIAHALRIAPGPGAPAPSPFRSGELVAESRAMREVVELARRVAATRSTVLLRGETGTGKELVASLIHGLSKRAACPYLKVNCAALPETLLESELFGHERGAFTGAERQRIGRFEQASGGTLFLDEVGDMSPTTQAKLLRVLEDQEFHRLGGTHALRTDARIVAATNQDLESAILTGHFREDLFFRLNVIGLDLPPLRDRPEDIVALAHRFLSHFSARVGTTPRFFSTAALQQIRDHAWPGNVRELRNAIERASLVSDGPEIGCSDIAIRSATRGSLRPRWKLDLPQGGISMSDVERELVEAALHRAGYVQKDAAQLLRISRRKLNYMISRMGLTHPSWRKNRGPEPPREPAHEDEGS